MKQKLTWQKLKEALRPWVRALTNPHLLISLGIAWFLTNGWAYCAAGIGMYAGIDWLRNAGMVWLGILWMPGTPEKIFTFAIAMGILRLLFPDDTRTLAAVRRKRKQIMEKTKLEYAKVKAFFRSKKAEKALPAQAEDKEQEDSKKT